MNLNPKSNLLVAETLLQRVKAKFVELKEDKTSIWYECFDNCREQGFVIIVWCKPDALRIAFSEHRNSDSIVVYKYRKNKGVSNLPDEGEWENNRHFGYGNYDDAAEYIFNLIKEEMK